MQITIDIPEESFNAIKNGCFAFDDDINDLFSWIANGTPLPKGYEDSENDVLNKIKSEIGALPKTYPFRNHFDTYVKEDDVKKVIDKYKKVIERNANSN